MTVLTRLALAIVIAHAAIATLHGAAHKALGVELSLSQTLFVAIVITVAPVLAGVLLWKRAGAAGAPVFLISMAGSFVFGVYYHFIAISPDHVSHVAATSRGPWATAFQVTAFLLMFVELAGIVVGALLSKRVFAS